MSFNVVRNSEAVIMLRIYKQHSICISISISISIIYLPSGTRGVVAQSPEPEAHDKSD